jgi:acyl-CoA reductase-like NAD-dependent aldehyde dehydrogenase
MEPTVAKSKAGATGASGNGAASGHETFEVHDPTDGSVIRTVEVTSPERVAEVVARVRAAQPEWEAMGFRERYRWLGRLRDWMFDNADDLADLMQSETGKVRADAELEGPFICDAINYWGRRAAGFLADETPSSHNPMFKVKRLRITYRPFPVVGVISPWNFPLILAYDDAIPALMAGAAAVIKPSEVTPLIAMEIARA